MGGPNTNPRPGTLIARPAVGGQILPLGGENLFYSHMYNVYERNNGNSLRHRLFRVGSYLAHTQRDTIAQSARALTSASLL